MIIEWSKPEVSLPLCKGAKLKQLNEGQQTGGYYRGKSSQSESKLTRNEVFAKITKETYCNLMIISLISIFLKKHINKVMKTWICNYFISNLLYNTYNIGWKYFLQNY